ncbi:MAPEG family protein [Rhizobacter sp. J219]|uniref:MAPEG family protein n=1 Tax=Rhizobacter sp. J219 TaxID=2898430 RepID=UPI002150DD8F|nr:MAPEG family protein [Rhizobacter sp. J219]MCR5883824.1 MAPEG family protein [Rhizobacter sp. J219]
MNETLLTPSLLALLGFGAWTLALQTGIAFHRAALVLSGQRRANSFTPWGNDVSPFSARLCRAHANCVENLPVVAALVVSAAVAGVSAITDPLALWLLAARVCQSAVHLMSTSTRAVTLRFAFMAAQMGVLGFWVVELLLLLRK